MKKSNFAQYKEEREGATVFEDERGFATAIPFGEFWYLDDIFVNKEHRRLKLSNYFADKICEIGRQKGYKTLLGSVDAKAAGVDASIKMLHDYKMKLYKVDGDIIYFTKKL